MSDVTVEILEGDSTRCQQAFSPPLEGNVARALELSATHRTDAAGDLIRSEGYSVLGGMNHNFTEDSFTRLMTAAETDLALGIASYWSEPAQVEHLLYRRAFPLSWWTAIQRRCAEAAFQFGLVTDGPMRSVMLEVGHFDAEGPLVSQLLSHYTEVNLNLRANELDPISLWENWDRLLAWAEGVGVPVDAQVEEIL